MPINLPDEMSALRRVLPSIVSKIEARAPYASGWASAREGLRINVDDREEQIIESPPTAGTVLTVFDGQTMREQAVGSFAIPLVEQHAGLILSGGGFTPTPRLDPDVERRGDFVTPMQIPPASLTTAEKLERIRTLHARARRCHDRLINVQVAYSESSEVSLFCNRSADLAQRIQRVNLFVVMFVAGENGVRYNYISQSGTGGWELLDFSDDALQHAAQGAVDLLSAERIQPGEYTIITTPGVTGTLVHESFGHGVETDMFIKQRARAAQYIDKPVGSPLVNIVDDPSYSGTYGSYFFDDEGCLAGPTTIVKDGVFMRGISDYYSATRLGIPRSANGRRQDFSRKAYARMSNTFFARGDTPLADLFAQVENGIYLEKWSSGMEDPQGWGIQVTCHYGHEIKNGKVTGRMFAPVGISGYVPDVLQSISAVGDDFEADGGGCGKGHKEWVSVSSGGPHLLMKARLG